MDAWGIFYVLEDNVYTDEKYSNQKTIVSSHNEQALELSCMFFETVPAGSYVSATGRMLKDAEDTPYFRANFVQILPIEADKSLTCELFIQVHAQILHLNKQFVCSYSPYDSFRKQNYGNWQVRILYPKNFTPPLHKSHLAASGKVVNVSDQLEFTIEMNTSDFCPRESRSVVASPQKSLTPIAKRVKIEASPHTPLKKEEPTVITGIHKSPKLTE